MASGLVGLQYGLIIGLLTGLFSFIPYIGMAVGFCVGMVVAAFQFQDLWRVALVAAVFGLGQFIEGNLVTPRLVGARIRVHPVWLIFAVLAGAALFGLLGAFLAVPVAAVLGVFVRFALERYRASALYGPEARAMSPVGQLLLGFEHEAASGLEDFLPAACNREALAWLERWPAWPAPALVLHGPPGCGKTHLARIWAARSGARRLDPAALPRLDERPAAAPQLLDPAEPVADEMALLQLYNRLHEQGGLCC